MMADRGAGSAMVRKGTALLTLLFLERRKGLSKSSRVMAVPSEL